VPRVGTRGILGVGLIDVCGASDRPPSAVASMSWEVRPRNRRSPSGRCVPGQVWPAPRDTHRGDFPGIFGAAKRVAGQGAGHPFVPRLGRQTVGSVPASRGVEDTFVPPDRATATKRVNAVERSLRRRVES
jgi:hypothetical protein